MFTVFTDVQTYLDSLVNFEHTFPLGGKRDRPKLQPTRDAVKRLSLSLKLSSCVHLAGTVGKGSVAGYLSSILAAAGPTLCFTSPHLISVKERVCLDGRELDDAIWVRGFSEIRRALDEDPKIALTYFESVWIFFLWAARELGTKHHVVEAGLGGSFDATNVLEDTVAMLTRIDMDHTSILGKTLKKIALDKSGIIKPSTNVISAAQHAESQQVIERISKERGAMLHTFARDFKIDSTPEDTRYRDATHSIDKLQFAAAGDYQRENAALAVRAALLLNPEIPSQSIREALRSYVPPARQQYFTGPPAILVDVAHNPASFEALAKLLSAKHGGQRIKGVIGMMRDKDARSSLRHLTNLVEEMFVVSTGNPRSYSVEKLSEIAGEMNIPTRIFQSKQAAFEALHQARAIDLGLVTGSFYVAGDYLSWRQNAGIA
jgi:dihydrofolate synthase/folylpolyglutamate synthase